MLESIKAVGNPLTIIAIFAALAEVAGTVALATVNKDLQQIFVWFVMGFPVLLVVLFFVTLNFNPRVLYAPSDFKDEENFLNTLAGNRKVSRGLDEVTRQLEEAKDRILKQTVEELTRAGGAERSRLSEILTGEIAQIESRIESVRRTADAVAAEARAPVNYPRSSLQARILETFRNVWGPLTLHDVAVHTGVSMNAAARALDRLVERRLVIRHEGQNPGEDSYTSASGERA